MHLLKNQRSQQILKEISSAITTLLRYCCPLGYRIKDKRHSAQVTTKFLTIIQPQAPLKQREAGSQNQLSILISRTRSLLCKLRQLPTRLSLVRITSPSQAQVIHKVYHRNHKYFQRLTTQRIPPKTALKRGTLADKISEVVTELCLARAIAFLVSNRLAKERRIMMLTFSFLTKCDKSMLDCYVIFQQTYKPYYNLC